MINFLLWDFEMSKYWCHWYTYQYAILHNINMLVMCFAHWYSGHALFWSRPLILDIPTQLCNDVDLSDLTYYSFNVFFIYLKHDCWLWNHSFCYCCYLCVRLVLVHIWTHFQELICFEQVYYCSFDSCMCRTVKLIIFLVDLFLL